MTSNKKIGLERAKTAPNGLKTLGESQGFGHLDVADRPHSAPRGTPPCAPPAAPASAAPHAAAPHAAAPRALPFN